MVHKNSPLKVSLNKPLFSHKRIHIVSHGSYTYIITDRIENHLSGIQCRRVKTRDFKTVLSWDKSNDAIVNMGQIVSLIVGASSLVFLAFYLMYSFLSGYTSESIAGFLILLILVSLCSLWGFRFSQQNAYKTIERMENDETYYLNPMGDKPFEDAQGNIKPITADYFCAHVDKKTLLEFCNIEKKIRAVQNGIIEARKINSQTIGEEKLQEETQKTLDEFLNMEVALMEKREQLCSLFRKGIKEDEQNRENARTNDISARIHGLREHVKRTVEASE